MDRSHIKLLARWCRLSRELDELPHECVKTRAAADHRRRTWLGVMPVILEIRCRYFVFDCALDGASCAFGFERVTASRQTEDELEMFQRRGN
jgi:hypothetical protein